MQEKEWKKGWMLSFDILGKRNISFGRFIRLYKTKQGYNKMKNIIRFILRLVQNPIVLAILWFGVAIRGFWVSWTEGLANNYLIFSRSFFHALEQTPLYVEYPKEYFDLFLYGIPFTLLIAPFFNHANNGGFCFVEFV